MAAWKIFSPLLTEIDAKTKEIKESNGVVDGGKYKPIIYPYGSRGPDAAEQFIKATGMSRQKGYVWAPPEAVEK